MNEKKHEHSGKARKSFTKPKKILMKAGVKEGAFTMIDIGSGTGYLSLAAAEIMGNGSKVYALDSYGESVASLEKELADKGIENVSAIKADAVNEIPLQKDTVDICLMSNVVHGFSANGEMEKVLKNINKVIKEDGRLIVIDFKKGISLLALFGPPQSIRLNPEEVESIVSPYGFALEGSFNIGFMHYGIIFKKVSLQDKFC